MDANTPLKQYDEIDVSNLVRFGGFFVIHSNGDDVDVWEWLLLC